jgi:glycosyltransferase involved in cell wall biosynthesis
MRFCFLAERQVGIGSAAAAIEPHIRAQGHHWQDVSYFEAGGLIERLPLPHHVVGTMRGFVQVTEALQRERFDALFFLTHNPAVFHPLALAKTPTLLWTDATPAQLDLHAEHYGHPVERFRPAQRVKAAMVKRTFQSAALCIGWSEWARASYVRDYGVRTERTAVVSPGVDLTRWRAATIRSYSGLPRLLFVGGHFERKGGRLLLEVFRTHLRGRAELDLVTRDPVLEGPGMRVHHGLTAESPALLELYRRASMFVLPTLADCFSIASLEAMAMGLPVIVSDVGGISDIVESGSSGFLIKPNDGLKLLAAIEPLLADPPLCEAFGARGRAIVEERFDAKKCADRLIELLARCTRHGSAL